MIYRFQKWIVERLGSPRLVLGLVLAVFFFNTAVAQEASKVVVRDTTATVVADGTMGEFLEPIDSLEKEKFPKNINIFTGRWSSLRIGMGFLYEYAGFSQDADAVRQMDSAGVELKNQFKVRDFRIFASGQLTTKRIISWK